MSDAPAPMPPPAPSSPPPAVQPTPKKHGCFFYGCITAVVLFLCMAIAGFLGVRYVLNRVAAVVEQYTETKPMVLPRDPMSGAEYQELQKRVQAFRDGLNGRKTIPPLVLTGKEINALIANDPGWKALDGKAYLKIEGEQIRARVSLPLAEIASRVPMMSRLKDRYLNGTAVMRVSLSHGALVVNLQALEANGQQPPPDVMTQIQSINFAQNAAQDPKTAAMIGRLESIELKDGALTITAKSAE